MPSLVLQVVRKQGSLLFALALISTGCSGPDAEAGEQGAPESGGSAGAAGAGGIATGDDSGASPVPTSSPDGAIPPRPPGGGCAKKTGAVGDQTFTLTSGGLERTYVVHVPENYDPEVPAMLVLSFHGFSSDASQQSLVSHMSEVASERGFLAAYPNGMNRAWNGGTCCPGAAPDDVVFVREMVAAISESYCVDVKRIYATGISNGGLFANRVSCELADLIAASAPIGSGIGVACQPTRPVAHLTFAGTLDPFVPYAVSVNEVQQWRELNGCAQTSSVVYQQGDATCEEWSGCSEGASVRLCSIDGGGHTWPGGAPIPFGKTSTDIDATREMLSFFEQHPMP